MSDQGEGIPAEQRKSIFYRLRGKEKDQSNTSGLGLAICRALVHLHGGEIAVEPGATICRSGGGTTGSVFYFSIPD